jgi:ABC-type sulfate transport system permease component
VALAVAAAVPLALAWRWRPVVAVGLVGLLFATSGTIASRQYWVPGTHVIGGLLTLQHAVPAAVAGVAFMSPATPVTSSGSTVTSSSCSTAAPARSRGRRW